MIIIDILKIIFAAVIILFLPGFFLVMALFPKKNELSEDDDWLFRIVLSVVLSILLLPWGMDSTNPCSTSA